MVRYASREAFGFAMDVIRSLFNKLAVIFQYIMTPLFVYLDIFYLVIT